MVFLGVIPILIPYGTGKLSSVWAGGLEPSRMRANGKSPQNKSTEPGGIRS